MRWLVVPLLAAAGCNLYISDGDNRAVPDAPMLPPDAPTVRGCGLGSNDPPPPLAPGTVRSASRLATDANEFAWSVERSFGARYIAGEVDGPPPRGLLACFEPDGTAGWSETDPSVTRWRALVIDAQRAPIVIGDLPGGGSVVRRIVLDHSTGAPWEVQLAGPLGAARLTDIALRPLGGVIVVGELTGALVIGGQKVVSSGGTDGLILELDDNGGLISAQRFGGPADDGAVAVSAPFAGTTAVAANTRSATFQIGAVNLTGNGGQDAVVFCLDDTGQAIWAHRIGGSGDDVALDVAANNRSRVFFAADVANADLGDGVVTGAAIVAYESGGVARWASVLVSLVPRLWDLAVTDDKVYTAGVYFQPATFAGTPMPGDAQAQKFVAELSDVDGVPGWIVHGDGPTGDADLEVGDDLTVAGPYLVNFDMGGVHLDPSTPHDIYTMSIAR